MPKTRTRSHRLNVVATEDPHASARAMAASFEETLSQHGLLAMLDLVMREHASVLRAVLDADGVLGLHQCIEHSVATIDQLSPPARAAAAVGAHVGVLIGLQVGLLLRHVETPQVH